MFRSLCATVAMFDALLDRVCANTGLVWTSAAKHRLSEKSRHKYAQKSKMNQDMEGEGKRTEVLNIASFDLEEIRLSKDKKEVKAFLSELAEEFYFYRYHVVCIQNITPSIFKSLSRILDEKHVSRRGRSCVAKYLAVRLFVNGEKSLGRHVKCSNYVTFFDSDFVVCVDSAVSSMHNRHYYEGLMESFAADVSGKTCRVNMPGEGINDDLALLTYFKVLKKNIGIKVANVFKTLVDLHAEYDTRLKGIEEERKFNWNLASFDANRYLQLSMKQTAVDMNRYLGLESNPSSNKFIVGNFGVPLGHSQRGFLCNILKYGYIPGHDYSYVFYSGSDKDTALPSEIPYKAIGSQVPIGFYTSDTLNEFFAKFYREDSLSCIYHTHQICHFATLVPDTSDAKKGQDAPQRRFESTNLNVPSCSCSYIVPDCYDDDGYSWAERKGKSQARKKARREIVESLERSSMKLPNSEDDSSDDFSGVSTNGPSSSGDHSRASSGCVIS